MAATAMPHSDDGRDGGGRGRPSGARRDDSAFRRPGTPPPSVTAPEPWTVSPGADEGLPTPLRAVPTAETGAPDRPVAQASRGFRPEVIEPDVVEPVAGPDWSRIITRSLALILAGLCAGILLSRPWAGRDDVPAPRPAESGWSLPAAQSGTGDS